MPEMTYAKAGVSIEREELAIKSIINWITKTFKFREGKVGAVMMNAGAFANVIALGEYALAMCMDGVGSKVLVAQELKKFDTIGIDLVAMNVNDLICVGAEPISMVDYIAFKYIDPEIMKELVIGLYEGAKEAKISVIGGETATLPEIITGIGENGFDLAATVIGVVEKDKIITGKKIYPGDVVLSIRSSGIHSNGLTLARKVLPKNMWMDLLRPTRIYVNRIMELIQNFDIHGLVNITGGGLRNLKRVTKFGFYLDTLPEPQMIFKKIQELGNVSDREMYRTFNMGVGFCVIVDEKDADSILEEYNRKRDIEKIGSVTEEPEIVILKNKTEILIG